MKILGIGIVELCVLLLLVVSIVAAIVLAQQYAAKRDAKNAARYLSHISKPSSEGQLTQAHPASASLEDVSFGAESAVSVIAQEARFFACFPALKKWRTSVGFSVLGVLAVWALNGLLAVASMVITAIIGAFLPGLHGGDLLFSLVFLMGNMALIVCCIAYAALIYPSYFTDLPLFESPQLISMLNLLFGWIVFGSLWNSCLTKSREGATRKRGISFIVYSVLMVAIAACQFVTMAQLVDAFAFVNVPHV